MAIQQTINRELGSLTDELGEVFVKNLKRNLTKIGKYNTGRLVDTLSYDVKTANGKAVLKISAQNYLRYVDKGRRPGKFPNINAISKWARARGISQRAVYPIAKKIADRGIKATNVVDKTYKETIKQFKPEYEEQLKNVVGVVLKNDIFNQTNTKGVIIPKNLR